MRMEVEKSHGTGSDGGGKVGATHQDTHHVEATRRIEAGIDKRIFEDIGIRIGVPYD
jgi:hypothetical protein